jgi:hypothetical protein
VIFVLNGQRGSLLGCDWVHYVLKKSLICKDAF